MWVIEILCPSTLESTKFRMFCNVPIGWLGAFSHKTIEKYCNQWCIDSCCEVCLKFPPLFQVGSNWDVPGMWRWGKGQTIGKPDWWTGSGGFPVYAAQTFPNARVDVHNFPWFPPRPSSRRFHLAPSQRGSPQAISHDGFPSVHLVVASVSLLPQGALQATLKIRLG